MVMVWIKTEQALRTKMGLGFLALVLMSVSYVLGAMVNTEVITQPNLAAPLSRSVVVLVVSPDEAAAADTEIPALGVPGQAQPRFVPASAEPFPTATVVLE